METEKLLLACTAAIILGLLTVGYWIDVRAPIVPSCAQEDVLIGFGEYENGRWSSYECYPPPGDCSPAPGFHARV